MGVDRRQFLQLSGGVMTAAACGACSQARDIRLDLSVPASEFGAEATAEAVTKDLDLGGKLALVTGCNSGIGFETLRVLALRGAHVIGTGRTLEKARSACDSVQGQTTPVELELTDFDSVVDCARTVDRLRQPIDMLICNAGIQAPARFEAVNGVERTFVVNHLGHFILVNRLLARVRESEQGRVVVVSSRSAWRQAPAIGIDFNALRGDDDYDRGETYGQSKLANALFSRELARRLEDSPATSNALHPGLVKTNIARDMPWAVRTAFDLLGPIFAKNLAEGAATSCYVATSPGLTTVSGKFFADCKAIRVDGAHHIENDIMAERLWAVSEELTRNYLISTPRPSI